MARRNIIDCDYCHRNLPPTHFGMSFQEMAPINTQLLTDADPEGLRVAARDAQDRANELEVSLAGSDHERGLERAAISAEASVRRGESSMLADEAHRVSSGLAALQSLAEAQEPLVKMGSGALQFCGPGHAAAFLASKYGHAVIPMVEAVRDVNAAEFTQGDELPETPPEPQAP